jgi:hypothetical protein
MSPKSRPFDAELQAEALRLLAAGHGYTAVAVTLCVPRRAVRALQKKHALPEHAMYRPAVGQESGFREALSRIAAGDGTGEHIKYLAARYGLNEDRALRIAHEVLGVAHFKRGKCLVPLQDASDWPRRCDVEKNRALAEKHA